MEAGAGGQPEAEALQYDTPQQLLDMAEHDRGGYLRGILQVLENAGEYLAAGRLPPSELKLPMQLAPYPTSIIRIKGYEGGEYSPGELGVGCTVVPPSEGRGSNTTGGWSLRSDGTKQETSQPGLFREPMRVRVNTTGNDPDLKGKYFKYTLATPPVDFLVPAATSSHGVPFVLMHERKGPVGFAAASEITPDDLLELVTGTIEHLSFAGPATSSDGGAGAGDANNVNPAILPLFMAAPVSGAAEAMRLKTLGNQRFKAGEFSSAVGVYSEAIALLEGEGDDAALATLLCNRSAAYLKSIRPAAALDLALADAERALALGGRKAHFRCAEALSSLSRFPEALAAYEATLATAKAGVDMGGVRDKIEELQRLLSGAQETLAKVSLQAAAHGGGEELTTILCSDEWATGKGRFLSTWVGRKGLATVLKTVLDASNTFDWTVVLEWEGRMEELLENQSNATCVFLLGIFKKAQMNRGGMVIGSAPALKAFDMEKRLVDLLGKEERFRHQGEAMYTMANQLFTSGEFEEAEKWYARTQKLAEAHGFFSLESRRCLGLGLVALEEKRDKDGMELLWNSLVAARLDEIEDGLSELSALTVLIPVLTTRKELDEAEPLVLRFREAAKEQSRKLGQFSSQELEGIYLSAKLQKARGKPHEAVNELRSLLDLLRANTAAVRETVLPMRQELRVRVSWLLKELFEESGEQELISMHHELVKLLACE